MLLLSKLDRTKILVPLESIKYIEETPDTLIRFLNGESVIVRETLGTIQDLAKNKDSLRDSSRANSDLNDQNSTQTN